AEQEQVQHAHPIAAGQELGHEHRANVACATCHQDSCHECAPSRTLPAESLVVRVTARSPFTRTDHHMRRIAFCASTTCRSATASSRPSARYWWVRPPSLHESPAASAWTSISATKKNPRVVRGSWRARLVG